MEIYGLFINERKKHVKAMMRAIKYATTPANKDKRESKTNGLRVIRRFESVNNIKFDPANRSHLDYIYGCAHIEGFLRKAKLILSKI